MINANYIYNPMQQADYSSKLPLEFLTKAMGELQQRSDRNYMALQEAPNLLGVPVDESDFQRRAEIESSVRNRIDNIVKSTNGDYSGVNKEVYGLQADIKRLLAPSGQLGAMANNYASINEYKKQILDDKTLSNEEKMAALNYSKNRFKQLGGTGAIDPMTGRFNVFNGERITGFDMSKYLKDFKEIKPILEEYNATYDAQNNYFKDVKTGAKINDPERIAAILGAGLKSNTDFQEWLNGRQRVGLNVPISQIEQAVRAEAAARSFYEKTEDVKYRFNDNLKLDLEREKFNYRKQRDAKLDAEEAKQREFDRSWQYTGMEGQGYKPVTLNDLNSTPGEAKNVFDPITGAKLIYPTKFGVENKSTLDYKHPVVAQDPDMQRSLESVARRMYNNNMNTGNRSLNNTLGKFGLKGGMESPYGYKSFDQLSESEKNDYFKSLDNSPQKNAWRQAVVDEANTRKGLKSNKS